MLSLPQSTEVSQAIPKKAFFEKTKMKPADREAVDADIARLKITNNITPGNNFHEGERVKSIIVLRVLLKQKNFQESTVALIPKHIPQHMVLALVCDDEVRLAIYHRKLFLTDWLPEDKAQLTLDGSSLDTVWKNLVLTIGNISPREGASLDEIIDSAIEQQLIRENIAKLENRLRKEKQPRRKMDIYKQIQSLKAKL